MPQVKHRQMDEVPDLARNRPDSVIGEIQPGKLFMLPERFWHLAYILVVEIQRFQMAAVFEMNQAAAFAFCTDFEINSCKTFRSTSSNLLM